jgi:hypothetical protein
MTSVEKIPQPRINEIHILHTKFYCVMLKVGIWYAQSGRSVNRCLMAQEIMLAGQTMQAD